MTLPRRSLSDIEDWDSVSDYDEMLADDIEVCGGWVLWSTTMVKFKTRTKKLLHCESKKNRQLQRTETSVCVCVFVSSSSLHI